MKSETIEEVAKREADEERRTAEKRALLLENRDKIAKEMPQRFFKLVEEVKQAVQRFNNHAAKEKVLRWNESAACAAHDTNPQADFSIEFSRDASRVEVRLYALSRSRGPDVFLIEASGQIKEDRFLIRIEGFADDSRKVTFRMTADYQKLAYDVDQLAERLVLAAVKYDRGLLYQP